MLYSLNTHEGICQLSTKTNAIPSDNLFLEDVFIHKKYSSAFEAEICFSTDSFKSMNTINVCVNFRCDRAAK